MALDVKLFHDIGASGRDGKMFIPVSFMHRKNCLDLGAKVGYHGLRTDVLDWRKSDGS